jgi:hypothetical protein
MVTWTNRGLIQLVRITARESSKLILHRLRDAVAAGDSIAAEVYIGELLNRETA